MTERQIRDALESELGWDNPRRRALLARLRYYRPETRLKEINRSRQCVGAPIAGSLAECRLLKRMEAL